MGDDGMQNDSGNAALCKVAAKYAKEWWESHSGWQGSEGGSSSAGSHADRGSEDKGRAVVLKENTDCKGKIPESGDGRQHKGPKSWERSWHQPETTTQGNPWWYGKQSSMKGKQSGDSKADEGKACPFWPPLRGSVARTASKTSAKEEEEEETCKDRTIPKAWDLMCGKNAPVTSALRKCGWSVEAYDWELSRDHDLTSPQLQKRLLNEKDNVDAVMKAMECSTLSRARDIPIPGHPNAPPPLRSHEKPMGLEGLSRKDDVRVEVANSLIKFMATLADQVADAGGAVVGENPQNSWYWTILELIRKFDGAKWYDTLYAACAMGGARHKRQKIRHNVREVCKIRSQCHHVHDADEWKPTQPNPDEPNYWCYPSKAEAEYTAELAWAIAIALSWWVMRTGRVKLGLQNLRMPEPQETGDRTQYLQWDDNVLRKGAMEIVGYRCGVEPVNLWGFQCPKRVCIYDLEEWPENGLYIGMGNPAWRLERSAWATCMRPGPDGSPEECVRAFAEELREGNWHEAVGELEGKTLVCECKLGYPCHGEALVLLWVDEVRQREKPSSKAQPRKPSGGAGGGRRGWKPGKLGKFAMAAAAASKVKGMHVESPREVTIRWSQPTIQGFVQKLFPRNYTEGQPFPCLEDILNSDPFITWTQWSEEVNPVQPSTCCFAEFWEVPKGWEAVTLGKQPGVLQAKTAVDPILGYGMGAEAHYLAAKQFAQTESLPWSKKATAEKGLKFAATNTVKHRHRLAEYRRAAKSAIQELGHRCRKLSEHIVEFQPEHVRKVASGINVVLIAVLVMVMQWPDWTLPSRFVSGFSIIGDLERTGVFRRGESPKELSRSELFAHGQKLVRNLDFEREMEAHEQTFLWESVHAEAKKGFCEQPVSQEVMVGKYGEEWAPVPCFVHQQPCGKLRRISYENALLVKKKRESLLCGKCVPCITSVCIPFYTVP